ncbi:MAG: bifunctional (p)ppGpp synthetase/guanosine-3',5'-bis(diphosphate) 3'-pyrophosphohydrolase [Catalinimonas sp.]
MITADLTQEKTEIVRRYRRLLRLARPHLKEDDARTIRRAFTVAQEAHKDMRRKSGEPYIYHPLAVAQIAVEEIGLGTTAIVSALLHDVVEDTDVELGDIERQFGPKVASIIDGLTKISGVFQQGSSEQAENFRKMLLTLSDDVRVILIKLADRLHNMRTLDSMPRNKQLKIASETSYIYAPLAHRLGLYNIKTELEDLSLKYLEADVYREIARKIRQTKDARAKFIRDFIAPIRNALQEQGFEFKVKGRPKSIHSIWNKMKKQNIPFEKVYDLFAVRIILSTSPEQEKAACWQVYSIVTDYYKPNTDRLRDWISMPKGNGYESLHTTVMSKAGQWVEVQIRTQRMDEIAEKGYAAHWKYKHAAGKAKGHKNGKPVGGLDAWINRMRELLEQADGSAIEFVDDFRSNLYNEEVFVFTPKGDLRTLPGGATALDFAFEIHSEIGAHCLGAKVNQKLVPISYQLNNGDQVEILTSSKQQPREDWLQLVTTTKARAKIKDHLREGRRQQAAEGRAFVERKLKQRGIPANDAVAHELRGFLEHKTLLDCFSRFGDGTYGLDDIARFLEQRAQRGTRKSLPEAEELATRKLVRERREDPLLIGEDMDQMDYTYGKCCRPIPGDDVFGFVTINDGIRIHRTTCPNATTIMSHYGYRVIKAKWTSQHAASFPAALRLRGTDRVGLVNDVTRVISDELQVNMMGITMGVNGGMSEGEIQILVHDTAHLDELIQKLHQVDGIEAVMRLEHGDADV